MNTIAPERGQLQNNLASDDLLTAYIRDVDGNLRVKGRGKPRAGEELVYLTAADPEVIALEREVPDSGDITFFRYMDAVMASDLKPTERLVTLVIAKHTDSKTGRDCHAKVETLAKEAGLGHATIERITPVLVKKGWLIQAHSGRGGSSKLANAYDLSIPIPHGEVLQTLTDESQSLIDGISIPHGEVTSVPSSPPSSVPETVPQQPPPTAHEQGTEEPSDEFGDSYWVGTSKKHLDGFFIRQEGHTRPRGKDIVQVNLTGEEVKMVFSKYSQYPYETILAFMLDKAAQVRAGGSGSQRAVAERIRQERINREHDEFMQGKRSGRHA
jgi:Helix-turn-helix domain